MSMFLETRVPELVIGIGRPSRGVVRNVADDIQRAMNTCGYAALRDLGCEFRAGVATLRGRVPSWYLRQVAQAVVRRVPGVVQLVDCLEVVEQQECGGAPRQPR